MSDTEQTLKEITCDLLGVKPEDISADTKFEDLGADSLDVVEILMGAEEKYGFLLDDDHMGALSTFQELVDLVTAARGAA